MWWAHQIQWGDIIQRRTTLRPTNPFATVSITHCKGVISSQVVKQMHWSCPISIILQVKLHLNWNQWFPRRRRTCVRYSRICIWKAISIARSSRRVERQMWKWIHGWSSLFIQEMLIIQFIPIILIQLLLCLKLWSKGQLITIRESILSALSILFLFSMEGRDPTLSIRTSWFGTKVKWKRGISMTRTPPPSPIDLVELESRSILITFRKIALTSKSQTSAKKESK